MPAILVAWAAKYLSGEAISAFFKVLFSPVGAAVCIVLAFGGGDLWGRHRGNQNCEARIAGSIAAAKTADQRIAAQAEKDHAEQIAAASAREQQAAQRIEDYGKTLQDKGDCSLDDADVQFLTHGLRGEPVQSGGATAPIGELVVQAPAARPAPQKGENAKRYAGRALAYGDENGERLTRSRVTYDGIREAYRSGK